MIEGSPNRNKNRPKPSDAEKWQTAGSKSKTKPLVSPVDEQFVALGFSKDLIQSTRFRDPDADHFHLLLCKVFNSKLKPAYAYNMHVVKDYLNQHKEPAAILLQTNTHKFSHLDDTLRLPYKFMAWRDSQADERGREVFPETIILDTLEVLLPYFRKIPLEGLQKLLEQRCEYGSNLLRHSIETRSMVIFNEILALYQKYPVLLEKALRNISYPQYGAFGVLQGAIMTKNIEIVKKVLALLNLPEHVNALKFNLENITTEGFTTLLQALATEVAPIGQAVLAELSRPEFSHALTTQLGTLSKNGYGVLQEALRGNNVNILKQVLTMLQQPKHSDALAKNLQSITREGFSCLHSAIKQKFFLALWQLPAFYERKTLLINLGAVTTKNAGSLTILHQALLSRDPLAVEQVANMLEKFPQLLESLLFHTTAQGFTTLQLALTTSTLVIVERIWALLQICPQTISFNLTNRTNEFYGTLHLAVVNPGKASFIIDILSSRDLLPIQLSNLTKGNVTVLQDALSSLSLSNIKIIIDLSEKNIRLEEWCKLLLKINHLDQNILFQAARTDNENIFELVITTLQKAFQENAGRVIEGLANKVIQNLHLLPSSSNSHIREFLRTYQTNTHERVDLKKLPSSRPLLLSYGTLRTPPHEPRTQAIELSRPMGRLSIHPKSNNG